MPILNVNQKRVAKPKPGIGDASDYTEMVLRNAQVSVQPLGAKRLSPTGNFLKFVPFWPAKKMYEEKLEYLNHIDDPPPYIPVWTTYGGDGCWTFTTDPPDASTSAVQTCDASPGAPRFGPFYAVLSQSFRGTCEFTMNVHYDTDIGFLVNPTAPTVDWLIFRIRPYVKEVLTRPPGYLGGLMVYYCGPMKMADGSLGYFSGSGTGFNGDGLPTFVQGSDRLRIEITTSETPVKYWNQGTISTYAGDPSKDPGPIGNGDGTTTDIIKVSIVSDATDGSGNYIGGGTVRYLTYIPIPPNLLTDGGLYPFVSSARLDVLAPGVPDEYKDFIFT